jgi:hypothetical protein
MKTKLFIASGALAAMVWAAPLKGAAHFHQNRSLTSLESVRNPGSRMLAANAVRFRVDKDRGLLLQAWIEGVGPYVFVLDTGAGMNVISQRVVTAGRVPTKLVSATTIGGLSSSSSTSNREAIIENLALGQPGNKVTSRQTALVVSNLPPDIDGIIDPTLAYAPYGYSIDMPNEQLEPLDVSGLTATNGPQGEGAVVSWVRQSGDTRPYVRLGDGRIALLDTGSGFGLAVNERNAVVVGNQPYNQNAGTLRDIAGGLIRSRRVQPTTISIGELVLRRIPTDILFGVYEDAPLILGREALYPFKISFDPRRRQIEFVTSSGDG